MLEIDKTKRQIDIFLDNFYDNFLKRLEARNLFHVNFNGILEIFESFNVFSSRSRIIV